MLKSVTDKPVVTVLDLPKKALAASFYKFYQETIMNRLNM